ncbi:hypothetical protein HPB50_021210 [Hyalomma asiaticum]|uniref:Uncharacterized protein n=1 Tax=Hyalomma asiaticum TaxID=266040 RepID=A0ACB7RW04_HYAAI|nr:hypothetical protein HPB50_021210 [Hyalomma asiaticum]
MPQFTDTDTVLFTRQQHHQQNAKGFELDLQKNEIADAQSLARSALPRLKELKLGQNCLSTVAKFLSRSGGNHIERLDFSNNFLTDIMPGAFHRLRRLITLDLSNNSISHLRDSYFARDSLLEGIDLSMNNLTAVSGLFFTTRKIRAIRLSFNHIRDIRDAFSGLTELRMLYLRSNKISSIPDGTFGDNLQLTYVDLIANNIAWIGRNAFKGLVTLRKLRLERNRIVSLNGSLNNLPKLEYLGASYNAILRLESNEFGNNAGLRSISLKENNITDLRWAFTGATALRFVNLAGNQVELIRRSNPLICDCRMAWLVEGDSDTRIRIATCAKPRSLKGKQLRVLAQQDLVRWKDDCEPGCQCECNEGPLGEREISVKCFSVTEGHVPKVLPKGTTRLDLSSNRLVRLDETVKKAAPLLQVLSLRDNMLAIVNATSIPERLTSLDLRGNKMKRLPFLLLTQLNLTAIWLSGNQYTCECSDYDFTQWIQAHANVVRDASEILCGKSANPFVSGKQFFTLGQNDLCPAKLPQGVVYVLLTLEALVVFAGPKGGYLLQDIIRDAVACSRRTLLVLTENFVASEWCRLEFRLAHQRALRDNINRLVIVLVEQLGPGTLDEDLRLYLRTANYLRWGEPNFWDRLLNSLATRRARNKIIVKEEKRIPELTTNAHTTSN